jgi:cytoskeletal protein CcmA (bactofilin family)
MSETKNDFPTVLGADAIFKGQLQFEKGVRLLGQFEGEISSSGELLVAEGAALNGDVKVGNIRVEGQLKGNVDAKTKVHLTSSARLEGDLQAQRLEVAEGAVLIGRCVVGVNGQRAVAGEIKSSAQPTLPDTNAKPRPSGAPVPAVAARK